MRITLRRIKFVKDITSRKDESISGDVLHLGRGSDQEIYLPNTRVALKHATLSKNAGDGYSIEAIGGNTFKLNGVTISHAEINIGDLVELGGYQIHFKGCEENDLMLEISERFSDQTFGLKQGLIENSYAEIEKLLPRKRLLALGLIIVILLAGLLIPSIQVKEQEIFSKNFHHGASGKRGPFSRECTGCHSRKIANSDLHPVKSFSEHPQFKIPIGISDENSYEYAFIDEYNGDSDFNQITFPHKKHLNRPLERSGREPTELDCSSCHSWNDNGKTQRVNFDDNCGECHRPTIPNTDRTPLPHGDLDSLVEHIRKYYSSQPIAQSSADKKEFKSRLMRPGKKVSKNLVDTSTSWQKMSDSTVREIVYYTGCNTCHEILSGSGENSDVPMRVETIDKIKWYEKAVFNHEKHSQNCSDCHASAESSESSFDVLLPEISKCKSCHGGTFTSVSNAPSDCVTCHQFHTEVTSIKN